jgi:hypothetical protein
VVLYPQQNPNVNVPPITGALIGAANSFVPWQPSTWPPAPAQFDQQFHATLSTIFRRTILDELRNVVEDILVANGKSPMSMVHRGHVVAVAYMCALDAISSYGYKNRNVRKFVREHFPPEYRPFAGRIYPGYRHSLVHAWNLFGNAALLPGSEPIHEENGMIVFGILHFVHAFDVAVEDFLAKLETDTRLQARVLNRYGEVTAPPQSKTLLQTWLQQMKEWLCP